MSYIYRGKREHVLAGDFLNGMARVLGPYRDLTLVFSDGLGWEHVSVSTPGRTPNWTEMCFIKDLFWAPEDVVMQLHPARSHYINTHRHCLHLWRPVGQAIPLPADEMVGIPTAEVTP